MFRRLPGSLPEDPSWEADLTKLGYFINVQGQIRQIRKPAQRFQFKITDNDRFNEVHKEAFHKCLRREIFKSMAALDAPAFYLPQLTTIKPSKPSTPIFMTAQEKLKTKKNIVIILNDHMQDLGIWAYRKICDDSFDTGSCTGTVKHLKLAQHDEPGVIILNPGQYYYSHKEKRALNHESWEALPRKSLYHDTVRANEEHNLVPGSRDREEHVATVFEKIVLNCEYVSKDADLYVVGICAGANTMIDYLDKHGSTLSSRVKAAAWVHPHLNPQGLKPELTSFIEKRSRSWVLSGALEDTCIGMPSKIPKIKIDHDKPRMWEDQDDEDEEEEVFCPTFSGGDQEFTECLFAKVQKSMFEFFAEVNRGGEEYENPAFKVVKPLKDDDGDMKEIEDGKEFTVRDATSTGGLLPSIAKAVGEVTEKVKKVVLGEDEVEVAGVAVPKDLLEKAGLD